MVAPIGATSAYATVPSADPATTADAQIVSYKKELSDCVNCDSAGTAEGKANIQSILDKINAAQERIARAAEAKSSGSATDVQPANSMLGNRLDTFA